MRPHAIRPRASGRLSRRARLSRARGATDRRFASWKTSPADKRRYYDTARGSATESAALLDVYLRLTLASEDDHRSGKDMLLRIVSMLVQLARSLEKR
jgi:hypothetical protein